MPIIKVFSDQTPAAPQDFATQVHELCVTQLQAAPNAVELIVVSNAQMLYGPKVFVEVHFRDSCNRTREVVGRFMGGIESVCQQHLGAAPRIRCYAVNQTTLFWAN